MKSFVIAFMSAAGTPIKIEFFAYTLLEAMAYAVSFASDTGATIIKEALL